MKQSAETPHFHNN